MLFCLDVGNSQTFGGVYDGDDLRFVLALFAAAIIGAFVSHRTVRAIGPVRAMTSDWASWTHKDFPMGLALSGTLVFYFLAALWFALAR